MRSAHSISTAWLCLQTAVDHPGPHVVWGPHNIGSIGAGLLALRIADINSNSQPQLHNLGIVNVACLGNCHTYTHIHRRTHTHAMHLVSAGPALWLSAVVKAAKWLTADCVPALRRRQPQRRPQRAPRWTPPHKGTAAAVAAGAASALAARAGAQLTTRWAS